MGTIYTFHRLNNKGEEFFYPIEIPADETPKQHAELNPGTLKVQDMDGNVVWSAPSN